MRAIPIAKSVFVALLISAGSAWAASGEVNARWNEGSKPDSSSLNLSVYEKPIGCDETRGAMLRIGVKDRKPGATTVSLRREELGFCLFFLDGKPDHSVRCASGGIDLTYDATANEYRGKYEFRLNEADLKESKMKGGAVRSGEFRAQYCKPRTPAKK